MRQLLRRLVAVIVSLSVLLPTLGLAHASCGMPMGGPSSPTIAEAPDHMAGHEHGTPMEGCERSPAAPGDHGANATDCPLLAHCGHVMLAAAEEVLLSRADVASRRLPAGDAAPLELSLEPESPPPRA